MANIEMAARDHVKDESASLLEPQLNPRSGTNGDDNISTLRHKQVVGFLKSVWHDEDVAMSEQAPPKPSMHARTATREEAMLWQEGLRGAPRAHSRRFFLVDYGIELLDKEIAERSLHVQLVAYTIFVLIFMVYLFNTVTVAHTFAVRKSIYDEIFAKRLASPGREANISSQINESETSSAHRKLNSNTSYSVTSNHLPTYSEFASYSNSPVHITDSTVFNAQRSSSVRRARLAEIAYDAVKPGSTAGTANGLAEHSLLTAKTKDDIWDWLIFGLAKNNTQFGPFSKGANIAKWNHVLGAVRLRHVRIKGDESPDGQGCYSQILSTAPQRPEGDRITGPLTPAQQCFERATPTNAKVAGLVGVGNDVSPNKLNSGMLPERNENGLYSYRSFDELAKVQLQGGGVISANTVIPWGFIDGEYGTYDMGGYAVDLPAGNSESANAILRQLRSDRWLGEFLEGKTEGGRVVALFVTFTTYNPNVNIFGYTRIMIEFAPSGQVHSSMKFRPFVMPGQNFRPGNASSQLLLTIVFGINVFLWLIALALHGCRSAGTNTGLNFDLWDYVDLINLILLAVQLLQHRKQQLQQSVLWQSSFPLVTNFAKYAGTTSYADFEEMSWWFEWERLLASINAITVFLKYFKLLRVSDRLSMLIHVVEAASQTLLAWFIIAGSFFVGYIFMGYILFGATLKGFSTISRSSITLFNYIIGQFDNADLSSANYAGANFYEENGLGRGEIWDGAGFASLKYVGTQFRIFLADPAFYFFSFNLIFYLFLMRVMVAMLVTAYTEVSTQIERNEIRAKELAEAKKDIQIVLPRTWRTSTCGKFLSGYIFSGLIPLLPELPSERHILQRLKADPTLLRQGYMSYPELEVLVREALSSNPVRCCGRACGKRSQMHEVNDRLVETICVTLLYKQQINMHRVPQVMALFKDIQTEYEGKLLRLAKLSQIRSSDNTIIDPSTIGLDGPEEKQKTQGARETKTSSESFPSKVSVQDEAEWTADIISGDALHAALYVYREHFENGRKMFDEKMKEQDAALRALTLQILDTEQQINDTFEYFSGSAIESLPYQSEEGKRQYEELTRINQERLARQRKTDESEISDMNDGSGDTDDDDDDSNGDSLDDSGQDSDQDSSSDEVM